MEITLSEQQKEKREKKTTQSLRDLWDNIRHTNISIVGLPEGREREKGTENPSEVVMAENSLT